MSKYKETVRNGNQLRVVCESANQVNKYVWILLTE